MVKLWRLLWLLFAMETAPSIPADEEPNEDEDEGEEEEQDEESDEPDEDTRDSEARIRSLLAANDRLAKKNKKLQRALEGVEGNEQPLQEARMENAFLRAAMERGDTLDLDTAWDLLHVRGFIDTVTVNGDGQVDGMSDAIEKLLDRYPWLTDDLPDVPEEDLDRPRRSANPPKMRKGAPVGPSKSQLQDRFPSLRRRS